MKGQPGMGGELALGCGAAVDTPLQLAFKTRLYASAHRCFSHKLNKSLLVLPLPPLTQESQSDSSQMSTVLSKCTGKKPSAPAPREPA